MVNRAEHREDLLDNSRGIKLPETNAVGVIWFAVLDSCMCRARKRNISITIPATSIIVAVLAKTKLAHTLLLIIISHTSGIPRHSIRIVQDFLFE